jgi:aminoglycoside phosphotransferase
VTTDWQCFFPPGTPVLALPSRQAARLYIPAHNPYQRWKTSSLYPASRALGTLYRLVLRAKAVAGLAAVITVHPRNHWLLGDFVRPVLPELSCAVVLVGYPGPTQKFVVQLLDAKGAILGYLKYAEKDGARERLRQERQMLMKIPNGVGPKLLKYGVLGDGEALLTTAVPGSKVPAKLPPDDRLLAFARSLRTPYLSSLEDHPWVRRVCSENRDEVYRCLEVLSGRDWPVVIQHGDCVPWNLVQRPDGTLGAIDWEYGTLQGFPCLDLIYFILQTSFLVHRWAPPRAAEYATRYLTLLPEFELGSEEARALTRLAAYEVFQRFMDYGQPPAAPVLGLPAPWWHTVWEG